MTNYLQLLTDRIESITIPECGIDPYEKKSRKEQYIKRKQDFLKSLNEEDAKKIYLRFENLQKECELKDIKLSKFDEFIFCTSPLAEATPYHNHGGMTKKGYIYSDVCSGSEICPHGFELEEEKDDTPGFRCHDYWTSCPICHKSWTGRDFISRKWQS